MSARDIIHIKNMEEHANANNTWTASPVAEGLHATLTLNMT